MIKETITEFRKSVDVEPLQYLAANRVAILMCESANIQDMIRGFRKNIGNSSNVGFLRKQRKKLRGKVKKYLKQMGIPNVIIDIAMENLSPIGFEIFKWIVYHVEDMDIDCSSNFCWTSQFNIDYLKTAEILVKNDGLQIKKRFKLASIYCLESEARSLWDQMTQEDKGDIRGSLRIYTENPIVSYWIFYVLNEEVEYWALENDELFKYAVKNGYLSATKFFFDKLEINMRDRMILNTLNTDLQKLNNSELIAKDHLAIVCFLVCQFSSEYQEVTSNRRFSLVFLHFLEWPMQKHFMTVVNRLRHHLTKKHFIQLLERIFQKITGDFKDYDYKELFMEVWHQNPVESKRYIRLELGSGSKFFMKFVKKHFRFVFKERCFALKAKFRDILIQQEISENETYFQKENVIFFKFLVQERVTTKLSIDDLTSGPFWNTAIHACDNQFCHLPVEELMHLMDGILETV